MIVVVDSSVWVSALHFALRRGPPRLAIERAVRDHTIAICPPIDEEILRVLTLKFGWRAADVSAAMAAILPLPLRVSVSGALRICRDPNDDMVIECAVVSEASCIVTGDKDLLALDSYRGIRIVTAADFLALDVQRLRHHSKSR
jgi:putative PIN family toxin of toxin-antitoxin system